MWTFSVSTFGDCRMAWKLFPLNFSVASFCCQPALILLFYWVFWWAADKPGLSFNCNRSWGKKKVFCLLEWNPPQGNRKAELVPFTLLNGDGFVFSTGGSYTYTVGLFSTHYKPSKNASFQASVAAWSFQYLRRAGIVQLADKRRGLTEWKGRSELQQ